MKTAMRNSCRGFTLIELLMTLTVSAILLALAVPAMSGFIMSGRLTASANDLLGAIGLARAEAVRLNRRVALCPVKATDGIADTSACVGGTDASWEGWMVFTDLDANDTFSGVDVVLRAGVFPGGDIGVQQSPALDSASSVISFRPDGIAKAPGSSRVVQRVALRICDASHAAAESSRLVTLDFGSRASVVREVATSCPKPSDPS